MNLRHEEVGTALAVRWCRSAYAKRFAQFIRVSLPRNYIAVVKTTIAHSAAIGVRVASCGPE